MDEEREGGRYRWMEGERERKGETSEEWKEREGERERERECKGERDGGRKEREGERDGGRKKREGERERDSAFPWVRKQNHLSLSNPSPSKHLSITMIT